MGHPLPLLHSNYVTLGSQTPDAAFPHTKRQYQYIHHRIIFPASQCCVQHTVCHVVGQHSLFSIESSPIIYKHVLVPSTLQNNKESHLIPQSQLPPYLFPEESCVHTAYTSPYPTHSLTLQHTTPYLWPSTALQWLAQITRGFSFATC